MVRPRLSLVVPLGLLLSGIAWVPTATAARDDDPPLIEVAIDSFAPAAPKPGDTVTISGTATNTSSTTLDNPQALACIDRQRLTERSEIAAIPAETEKHPNEYTSCGRIGPPAYQEFKEPLKPGETLRYSVTIDWREWRINRANGVYVVGIQLRGNPDGEERVTVGRSRTLMPVMTPDKELSQVRTALVLPLQHRPTQFGGETFADESLGESLLPNGRLGRLLDLGANRLVTWLIDPAMLDEVRRMADGYQVLTPSPDNKFRPGNYASVAADWLSKLNTTRARNPIVLLPYGDPDVESLVSSGQARVVGRAREFTTVVTETPHEPASSGLWLESGSANAKTLVAGTTGHTRRAQNEVTFVSNLAWPSADRPAGPPLVNIATPAGPVRSVVTDATLTAGGPDPASAATPIQLRQRFASETALQATASPAGLVAIPPRGFDPTGTSTAVMLEAMRLPWVRPVLVDAAVANAAPRGVKAPSAGRPGNGSGLSELQRRQVRELDRAIATYGALVADPERAGIASLRRGLTRSASYAWRGAAPQAQRFLSFQLGQVTGQLQKVHIVNSSGGNGNARPLTVTLSGSKGQFPLTIANELDQTVRVDLRVAPVNRTDLEIEPFQVVRVGPRQKATFQVKASAEANGLIRAQAQVLSPDGQPVGPPRELLIEAAQYGSVGWFLVGGAVALLFGTSFVRIYRRIHTERKTAGAEAHQDKTPATAGT